MEFRLTVVAVLAAMLALPLDHPATAQVPSVQLVQVVSGLTQPVFATHDGSGSDTLYVVEQPGVVKQLVAGTTTATTFLDLSERVLAGGERGLLGLAFAPSQAPGPRLYVHYTRKPDGAVVISEFAAPAPGGAFTERVLMTIPHPLPNHNGGMLAFGPDGYLYISLGDGGGAFDPFNRAQNLGDLLGKLLRIDPRPSGGGAYTIPPDNPFVGVGGARPEIWALGFRNPWRFSFDRASGAMWVGDVGQGSREELDIVAAGGNYGWRVYEGTQCTLLDPLACDPEAFAAPVLEYATHEGGRCAITGGYGYRGTAGLAPHGSYVYGDFCSGELFLLPPGGAPQMLLDTGLNISSFGEDAAGELLVVDIGGAVYRLMPG
ncbi:MAG: PQQ-dependent sugar dehydrogenase, partial [Acidimicrobiales bacterium]